MQINTSIQLSKYCKNHPSQPSNYFITDQPWLKYCKLCAFNIALCGKKIQKYLSPQQFDKKMTISSISSQLKKNIQQIQSNNIFYNTITKMLQEVSKPIQQRLKQIQQAISQLMDAKSRLKNIYNNQIADKIRLFYQKQSKMSLNCMQIKKQLQNIQSHFGTFIQLQNHQQFQTKRLKWNNILHQNRKQLLKQSDYTQINNKLMDNINQFQRQFDQLLQFKIKTQYKPEYRTQDFRLNNDRLFDKLQKISYIQDQFNMTLTPIQPNSLNVSHADIVKSQNKKGQLKLRSNRKSNTDRESKSSSKTTTKRSIILGENISIQMIMSGKKNYR